MKRLFKQFIIACVYFLLFAGFAWLMWGLFYVPTCTDGIKNQNEENTDCGGVCQSCEIRSLSYPLVARKIFSIDPQGNATDVAIQLKNPNLSWGLKSFDYKINFLDSSNRILPGSLSGKS